MVDYFSDLTYVDLIRSTSQEGGIPGNAAFERWADTFGVKNNRYYADNGRFLKNLPYQQLIIPTSQ